MISKEMSIKDVVSRYPETFPVFQRYGLGCMGCGAALFENIEQGAEAHGVDANALVADLNVAISER
jgi:hybrid cluster-associated redox disulfide protein